MKLSTRTALVHVPGLGEEMTSEDILYFTTGEFGRTQTRLRLEMDALSYKQGWLDAMESVINHSNCFPPMTRPSYAMLRDWLNLGSWEDPDTRMMIMMVAMAHTQFRSNYV